MRTTVATALALCSLTFAAVGCGGATEESSALAPVDGEDPNAADPNATDPGTATPDAGAPRDAGTVRDSGTTRDSGTVPTPTQDAGSTTPTPNPGTNVTPTSGNTAAGVTINEVALLQGVKISLARAGAAVASTSRLAPVIPGRPGLVRVFVTPTGGARTLRAELTVTTGSTTFTRADAKTIAAASTDAAFASTFNFDLAGTEVGADTRWSVKIYDTAAAPVSGDRSGSLFPASGEQALGALTGTDRLRIVYVPVRYMADGSGRVPDTSAAAIQRLQNAFLKQYPVARVEITVRAPYTWNSTISPNGSGFSQILQAGIQLRAQDNPSRDTYYYLAFNPAQSEITFCSRGCVAGLSGLLTSSNDYTQRASVGLGYTGIGEGTAVHEVGHAHGRPHSQGCGADSYDPGYPSSYVKNTSQLGTVATIGSWGWDILGRMLFNPASTYDFMGYCDPTFVSDYTYGKLFTRIRTVNTQSPEQRNMSATPTRYRFVEVKPDGGLAWGSTVDLDSEPESGLTSVSFDHADGTIETVRGHYYPYGELNGGYMLVPEPKSSVTRLRILDRIGQVQSVLGRL
jgi:hypothetical protein